MIIFRSFHFWLFFSISVFIWLKYQIIYTGRLILLNKLTIQIICFVFLFDYFMQWCEWAYVLFLLFSREKVTRFNVNDYTILLFCFLFVFLKKKAYEAVYPFYCFCLSYLSSHISTHSNLPSTYHPTLRTLTIDPIIGITPTHIPFN